MIRGIFQAFDRGGFQCLVGVRQFLHGLVAGIFQGGKGLRTSGLASTAGADLCGIRADFV
jgi:hypothetical protein